MRSLRHCAQLGQLGHCALAGGLVHLRFVALHFVAKLSRSLPGYLQVPSWLRGSGQGPAGLPACDLWRDPHCSAAPCTVNRGNTTPRSAGQSFRCDGVRLAAVSAPASPFGGPPVGHSEACCGHTPRPSRAMGSWAAAGQADGCCCSRRGSSVGLGLASARWAKTMLLVCPFLRWTVFC